jgi:hypothetical protein
LHVILQIGQVSTEEDTDVLAYGMDSAMGHWFISTHTECINMWKALIIRA